MHKGLKTPGVKWTWNTLQIQIQPPRQCCLRYFCATTQLTSCQMKLTRRLNVYLYGVSGSKDSRCLQALRYPGTNIYFVLNKQNNVQNRHLTTGTSLCCIKQRILYLLKPHPNTVSNIESDSNIYPILIKYVSHYYNKQNKV